MNEQDLKHLDLGFHRKHFAFLMALTLVSVLFSLVTGGTAHASTGGCAGRVSDYAVTGGYIDKILRYPADDKAPGPGGIIETYEHGMVRITGTPVYMRCSTQGDGHGHIVRGPVQYKVQYIDWCWNWMVNQNHFWFQGVRVQGRLYDAGGTNVRPGEVKIPNINSTQNCITQDIPESQEQWQQQHNLPLFRFNFMVTMRRPMDDQQGLRGAVRLDPHKDFLIAGPHW